MQTKEETVPNVCCTFQIHRFHLDWWLKTHRNHFLQTGLSLFQRPRPRPTLVGAWVLGALLLLPGFTFVAIGQEPLSETSSDDGLSEDEQPQADESTAGTGDSAPKRRFLKRLGPQQVTAEQREEAERIRKLAAKYGTDPTAIVSRVQLSSQYADLARGAQVTDTVARVDLVLKGNFLLRVDTPFRRTLDLNRPGASSPQGLGDLSAVLGWRVYNTPEYAVLIGAASTFPTADERGLGFGKYTTGPFAATARFLPRWDSFLFGVFQHLTSVGGDPARQAVSLTRAIGQVNTIWADRWWTIVQTVWQVDWERSGKTSMALEFEVGRSLVGRFGMFVRPGVGIWGR